MKLSRRFNTLKSISKLEKLGIALLSYEYIPQNAEFDCFSTISQYSDHIYKNYYANDTIGNAIMRYFGINMENVAAFRVLLRDQIYKNVSPITELYFFARKFERDGFKVVLFAQCDKYTRRYFRNKSIKNIFPYKIKILKDFLLVPSRYAFSRFIKKIRFYRKLKTDRENNKGFENSFTQKEILYFPHQGIFYGRNLFLKDHFYANVETDPFHPKNILHLSLGEKSTLLQKSVEYYKKRSISYCDLTSFPSKENKLRALIGFIRTIRSYNISLYKEFAKFGIEKLRLYFSLYFQIDNYKKKLSFLKNAKMALIGYDILFPKALSLAMALKGITTIAVQERFISMWYEAYNKLIFDYYFVMGDIVKNQLKKLNFVSIKNIEVIGPIRLDSIYNEQMNEMHAKYKEIKENRKLVLVLDYHSCPSKIDNARAISFNWKVNRIFYLDIISLSKMFPDGYFVIKGKNSDVLKIDEFNDIINEIDSLPNISFETELDYFTPAKMAAYSDITIARHTSLGDEILASGKPVLFYDYFGVPTPYFDYDGFPVIVHTKKELIERFGQIMESGNIMNEKLFQKMREDFFNDSFDGRIRERLHSRLLDIYYDNAI